MIQSPSNNKTENNQPESFITQSTETEKEVQECQTCRFIGSTAGILTGSYLIYEEEMRVRRRRLNHLKLSLNSTLPINKNVSYRGAGSRFIQFIGFGLIGLGIARATS
ncbi:hypothetical protein BY996DRAFT_6412877 [Phakopsora pachyrhizi]|uniref:Expressed protein n=1 Tax=Phakopsora pachyrhizi TaxID=170000 RepID=A0AAV0ARS0_PHAPC|nr:hypothetical protein BY996DRAFT_6412877 [Phakopsora pachyrhizi]CAH7672075.1 expressed protein [Phakopsora pachyrhizi]